VSALPLGGRALLPFDFAIGSQDGLGHSAFEAQQLLEMPRMCAAQPAGSHGQRHPLCPGGFAGEDRLRAAGIPRRPWGEDAMNTASRHAVRRKQPEIDKNQE
jgi:hypothetical protein